MLRAARQAKTPLADAARSVAAFVRAQADPAGGFRDRSGKPDLYYTVFGLQCLLALGEDLPAATAAYLRSFADPRGLDFIHAACLARCWALVRPEGAPAETCAALAEHLRTFRSADGGYTVFAGADSGSAYGAFLALGAFQDLGAEAPDPGALAASVRSLRMADGGCTNDRTLPFSSTPGTAACLTVLCELSRPNEMSSLKKRSLDPFPEKRSQDPFLGEMAAWILACVAPSGGLAVTTGAPMADLLSTATGLHALWRAGASLDEASRLACAGFAAGLATESGGFRGQVSDDAADCEYTFYGLLTLGHLAGGW
jgi:hypothetical protein